MYSFYYYLFLYFSVFEVLLFMVMMLFYIILLNDLFEKCFNVKFLFVVMLVILGVVVICYEGVDENYFIGMLMV